MYNNGMNEKDIDPELSGVYKILEAIIDCKILEHDKKEQSKKAQDKSQKESKQDILERIKRNSSGLVDRDECVRQKTWIVGLYGSPTVEGGVSVSVLPVDRLWTGQLHFKSILCAADSIENNLNDWFRLLS